MPLLLWFQPASSALACVVGSGNGASCTETVLNACLPGGGTFDGTVTFNCGGAPATIIVTSTKTISTDTTIDGGGLITISGGNTVQVFTVNSGVTFTVQNLTIADGKTSGEGAGIHNSGTTNVTNCTFSGNTADPMIGEGGAIWNDDDKTTTIHNSTFSGNSAGEGGAIWNGMNGEVIVVGCTFSENTANSGEGGAIWSNSFGTVRVTASTFSKNTANSGEGGAIWSNDDATVTVAESTFSENTANSGEGGAIWSNTRGTVTVTRSTFSKNTANLGEGGAIWNNFDGIVTVANCTFVGNTANLGEGGAIWNNTDGTVTVLNCTFSGNRADEGGAVWNGTNGTATLVNTIVADDSGGNCFGSITDGGHNIDDGMSCGFSSANHSLSNTDPGLDPAGLADNGGPTQTIALLLTSPAIDAGDNAVCRTPPVDGVDQRGEPRFSSRDANCDIGAFEVQRAQPAPAASGSPSC